MNPDAARWVLGKRPQSWWATEAGISTAKLTYLLQGEQGCDRDKADRLAAAVGCPVGMLFPELANFTVRVRQFTAADVTEAAA